MLKLIKKKNIDWELLMEVLSGEKSDNHPEFVAWLEENEDNKVLYAELCSNKANGFNSRKMYKKIRRKIDSPSKPSKPSKYIFFRASRYAATAAVALVLSFVIYQSLNKPESHPLVVQEVVQEKSVEPGSKKAILTLEDGSTLELKKDFTLAQKEGITIKNDTTGVLSYKQLAQVKEKPEMHSISVPFGGEYELVLSDGTKVFVNSGSTLRFPSFFHGETRKVELTGEAYFEVVKTGIPFIVGTSDADVLVLGTSFNLSAYTDDHHINATLISGSILLKTPNHSKGHLIQPGQNLNLAKDTEEIKIENVDTRIYTAWIHGEYIFRNETLENMLVKLSKWYDFTLEFEKQEIKKMRFSGIVEKERPLSYFLNQIETVTNLKFKEYGNKVKVNF